MIEPCGRVTLPGLLPGQEVRRLVYGGSLAAEVDRSVQRDPPQPAMRLGRLLLGTLRIPAQEDILDDIQGVVVTPQKPVGPAVDLTGVLLESLASRTTDRCH